MIVFEQWTAYYATSFRLPIRMDFNLKKVSQSSILNLQSSIN
jgi:hypothetical protein